MGFLSKLLGDAKTEQAAKDLFKGIVQTVKNETASRVAAPAQKAPAVSPGGGWPDRMPAEENQFSYPGSYLDYFTKLYTEAFPDYQLQTQPADGRIAATITFWKGDDKALVVELMSEKSGAQKLRNNCAANGVPYLRFYYDHAGWWNTKSYVLNRTRGALGC